VLYAILKAHAAYTASGWGPQGVLRASHRALARALPRLLVPAFALQIVILYAMETAEQLIVWGHPLAPTVWLGGPIWFSLGVHAVICVIVAFVIAKWVRLLANTSLRVIRLIRAFAILAAQLFPPRRRRLPLRIAFKVASPVLCRIGERGPPVFAA
jgi:hypothetical protein